MHDTSAEGTPPPMSAGPREDDRAAGRERTPPPSRSSARGDVGDDGPDPDRRRRSSDALTARERADRWPLG